MHKLMVQNIFLLRSIAVLVLLLSMGACSYIPWFGDDEEVVIELREPAELTDFIPKVRIQQNWQVSMGGDAEKTGTLIHPHVYSGRIAYTETGGKLAVFDAANGRSIFSMSAAESVSAGVGGNERVSVLGTLDGEVIAINEADATQLWSVNVDSEVVAIANTQDELAIVRTNDNRVIALAIDTGEKVWTVSQTSPALTLRGAGLPLIRDGVVYAGMDNGKVIAIAIDSGNVIWEARVSIPSGRSELDRLVDIDGHLALDEEHIYAASYHGRVVAISRVNGRISWARDIASISGVSVDDIHLYVSDRDDNVWALEKRTGVSVWKQEDLLYRQLSTPITHNNTVLVGDGEGYLHALSIEDGSIVGRTQLGKKAIRTSPLSTSNVVYIGSTDGRLAAYSVVSVN